VTPAIEGGPRADLGAQEFDGFLPRSRCRCPQSAKETRLRPGVPSSLNSGINAANPSRVPPKSTGALALWTFNALCRPSCLSPLWRGIFSAIAISPVRHYTERRFGIHT